MTDGARGELKVPLLFGVTSVCGQELPAAAEGSLELGEIAQLIEYLFSMHETLGLVLSITYNQAWWHTPVIQAL